MHGRRDRWVPALEKLEDRLVPSTTAANFVDGVWRWDTGIGWTHLTTQQASQLALDDAGNVIGQFANGLWRWNAQAGWQQLSTLTTQEFQLSQGGILYGDFGSAGTWRWSAGGWLRLSDQDVTRFAVGNTDFLGTQYGYPYQLSGPESYFGVYAGGTWRWTPTEGWSFLTTLRPDRLETDNLGSLVGVFSVGTRGSWRWSPYSGWRRLSYITAQDLAVARDGTVYEDRGAGGIHKLPLDGDFSQISTADATAFAALPNGDLLLVLGASQTAWHYRSASNTWNLVGQNLAASTTATVGKDNDVFLDAGVIAGLRRWNATTGNVQLSPLDPDHLAGQG